MCLVSEKTIASVERSMQQSQFVVGAAKREDCSQIMKLIVELAEFEKMPEGVKTTCEILERDGFYRRPPAFLAYVVEEEGKPGVLIGYSICYTSYSTFSGKAFFIEDIMLTETYRGKGLGTRLFQHLCKEALILGCGIIRFYVLDWNPAGKFYCKMGAVDSTKKEGWHWHIMYKDEIEKVAAIAGGAL